MNLYGVISKGLLAAGCLFFAFILYGDGDAGFATGALALGALFVYLAWRDWRRPRPAPGAAPAAAAPPTLRTALVTCGILLALDVLFFGAPALGMYALIALVVWLLPRILFVWRTPELRRHRARVALVTAGFLALDLGAYWVLDEIAQRRVASVSDALDRYKARHGAYPQKLQSLVPDYLPEIPAAKSGLVMFGDVLYLYNDGAPGLMYVTFPPFGRRVLNVETRKWEFVD